MTQITTPTTEPFAIPPGLEKAWKQLERKNNTFLSTTSSGGALVQSDTIETVAEYWLSFLTSDYLYLGRSEFFTAKLTNSVNKVRQWLPALALDPATQDQPIPPFVEDFLKAADTLRQWRIDNVLTKEGETEAAGTSVVVPAPVVTPVVAPAPITPMAPVAPVSKGKTPVTGWHTNGTLRARSQVWVTHPLVDGLQRWRAPESAAPSLKPREHCVYGLRTPEEGIRNDPSTPLQGAAGASNTPPPYVETTPQRQSFGSGTKVATSTSTAVGEDPELSPLPYPHSSYCKVALVRGEESKTKQPAPTRKLLSPSDHAGVIGITRRLSPKPPGLHAMLAWKRPAGGLRRLHTTRLGLHAMLVEAPGFGYTGMSSRTKASSGAQRAGPSTPTAAPAARSVNATSALLAPFGTTTPRLPSHMMGHGRRGPQPVAAAALPIPTSLPAPRVSPPPLSVPTSPPAPPRTPPVSRTLFLPEDYDGAYFPTASVSDRASQASPGSVPLPMSDTPTEVSDLEPSSGEGRREEEESISAGLAHRRGVPPVAAPPRLFQHGGKSIDLFQEELAESVMRHCIPYDPLSNSQEDPLLEYRAIGGELPGFDPTASIVLRDALLRYDSPHRNLDFEHLGALVEEVLSYDAAAAGLVPSADLETQKRFYCLNLRMLSRIAHAVVALQQIMDAQAQFLDSSTRNSQFVLDPGYGFLYLLERSESATDLHFAFTCLQKRVENGNRHILTYFCSIRQTLTSEDGSDRLSSADSTISEVRKEFGSQHPLKEVYRLLLRSDYALRAALIDDDARVEAVRRLGEEPRPRYYCSRSTVPTLRDGESAPAVLPLSAHMVRLTS
ncbi:hypothetical protein B0H14DRAFT_3524222 [Mycena olivaceomarginata]|nr:hypothetical protein B0H14DRAFT_3524222 [Mycena olivaceomarginata]